MHAVARKLEKSAKVLRNKQLLLPTLDSSVHEETKSRMPYLMSNELGDTILLPQQRCIRYRALTKQQLRPLYSIRLVGVLVNAPGFKIMSLYTHEFETGLLHYFVVDDFCNRLFVNVCILPLYIPFMQFHVDYMLVLC